MVTFDGVNRLIILDSDSTTAATLWSRWVDWQAVGDNSKYLPAMRFVGGDPISDVKLLGMTFFLINGWRIRPREANHRLVLEGNLFTDPAGQSPFVNTIGNFNVMIEMAVSNLSDSSVAQLDQINAGVYRGQVAVNQLEGAPGTTFPRGTHEFYVNNFPDAVTIANNYGIELLVLHGNVLLTTGDDVTGFKLLGENAITTHVVIEDGAIINNTELQDMFITNSVLDENVYLKHVFLSNSSVIGGFMEDCMFSGTIGLKGNNEIRFVNCKSGGVSAQGTDAPRFDFAEGNIQLAATGYSGGMVLMNSTNPLNTVTVGISAGSVIVVDPSCTGGTLTVHGIGKIINNGSMTINTDAQIDRAAVSSGTATVDAQEIADAVWNTQIPDVPASNTWASLLKTVLTVSKFLGLK